MISDGQSERCGVVVYFSEDGDSVRRNAEFGPCLLIAAQSHRDMLHRLSCLHKLRERGQTERERECF